MTSCLVVGGGLAGSLLALMLKQARRFERVEVAEARERSAPVGLRSINLALSERGLAALRRVGLVDAALALATPMYARAVHQEDGIVERVPYAADGRTPIYSVSRHELNEMLVDAAMAAGVVFRFGVKMDAADVRRATADYTLVVGADGAWSKTRAHVLRAGGRVNYSQDFLEHGYKELTVPPSHCERLPGPREALHIWPRGQFMMIALPNADRSYTATVFAPFDTFAEAERDGVVAFFERHFPDSIDAMPTLVADWSTNPTSPLVTIRTKPWSAANCVLIGDAAHAIVPFFGQGMNASMEDARLLADALCGGGGGGGGGGADAPVDETLACFAASRVVDASAIADMALENYVEMRDLTADDDFRLRRRIELELGRRFPGQFVSRYERVSFSSMPYAQVVEAGRANDRLTERLAKEAHGDYDQVKWPAKL